MFRIPACRNPVWLVLSSATNRLTSFSNASGWQLLVVVISQHPEVTFLVDIALLVAGSLHCRSFPRIRPAFLLLAEIIRRSIHASSSGLPQRKRTYLPKRTWGKGSVERLRTCSRIHDSGRHHRLARVPLSTNSY